MQGGCTALHLAADREHEDVVQLLIEVDADPDLQDKVIDHQMVVQLTADCGGCIVMCGSCSACKQCPCVHSVQDKDTALIVAAGKGSAGIVKMLIQCGTNMNLTDKVTDRVYSILNVTPDM